jgi:hypothetical protein
MEIAWSEHLPLWLLVLVIGVTGWFGTSGLVRAEVLTLRERDFVAAARALGAGPMRIIVRHVLPNVAAPIIVSAALGIGNVMLLEAGLSFLGIGVQPPLPSWGNMTADGAPSSPPHGPPVPGNHHRAGRDVAPRGGRRAARRPGPAPGRCVRFASELAARHLSVNRQAVPLQREMPSRGFSRAPRGAM